jgi:hypothetical protein
MTFERSLWLEMKRPRYWLTVIPASVAVLVFVWLWFTY